MAVLFRLRIVIFLLSRTAWPSSLGPRIWILRRRISALSTSCRDDMVGTRSPKWRRLHQCQHPATRVSRSVHNSSDLSTLCIKYSSPLLSFVSLPPPSTASRKSANTNHSGYDLQNGEPGQVVGTCMSALTSGQVLTYLGEVSGAFEQTSMTITTSSAISAVGLAGWNVATPTTSPSQSSSSPSSGGTGTSQPDTTQHSSGLSTGAMAGIGVSAAIGGIGIIALVVAVVLLRRRPKGVVQYNAVPPVQADSKEIYSGHPVHEMGINRKPVELPSQR